MKRKPIISIAEQMYRSGIWERKIESPRMFTAEEMQKAILFALGLGLKPWKRRRQDIPIIGVDK